MRRICAVLLVLALPAAASAAQPPASGRVVGATVAVSGVTTPAAAPARAVAAAEPAAARPAAADRPVARAAAASATVAIRDFSFGPSAITVHVGDTITWANAGPTPHTATADDGAFDTGTLSAGQSGSHTFASAGTFAYHCTLHPSMSGSITVLAASAPAPAGGSTTGTAAPTSAAPRGPTLPRTGLSAPGLAGLGALMLLCGVVLRALTRPV
jgi:plastocyanin